MAMPVLCPSVSIDTGAIDWLLRRAPFHAYRHKPAIGVS